MTILENINQNLPFPHITPSAFIDGILKNGLEARRCNASCVVLSDKWEYTLVISNKYDALQH